jgi:hypothetical protein
MKRVLIVLSIFAAVTAAALVAVPSLSVAPTAEAAPRCFCPAIYAPVICNHNRVFDNQCFADCRHAKNCVPLDGV